MVSKANSAGPIQCPRAFSVVEVIVVVGAIGVLAAVLIPSIMNVMGSVKSSGAEANLEMLNQAVLKYNHSVSEITTSVAGDISDEQAVVTLLKARDPLVPGSPFLESTDNTAGTTDDQTYRAVWNGRMFELVSPGTGATGINLMEMTDR